MRRRKRGEKRRRRKGLRPKTDWETSAPRLSSSGRKPMPSSDSGV